MTTKTRKTATAVIQPKTMNVARSELLEPTDNPWTVIPKFKVSTVNQEDYVKVVQHSRFFYKTEPLVSTTIDKLVEIGVTDLVFGKNKLSDNEFRVFEAVKPRILEFCDQMATEYLLSGFVIPEVGYAKVDKDFLFALGVKKYPSLELPDSMYVRDPTTVKIKKTFMGDKVSYFVKVPTDVISFIRSKGVYPDGSKDPALYEIMAQQFPEFVKAILDGQTEFLLINPNIIRRKFLSDNPYPIPYIQSALEPLHHKRKLRRMDYSVMDKVISAIMHVKIGDKDFPITQAEEDQEYVEQIASQLRMRGQNEQVLERIFQLITNHTVNIQWIFPETATLLDQEKYVDINQEILFGLGFPRVLITGEAQKSGTSDSEIATLSPIKTAEDFRRKIIEVVKDICIEISKRNNFTSVPTVKFKAISLHKFQDMINALRMLYDTASASRTTLADTFGLDWPTEVSNMVDEKAELAANGLSEFGATPNSKNSLLMTGQDPAQQPQQDNNQQGNQPTQPNQQPKTGETKPAKPKQPAKTGGGG